MSTATATVESSPLVDVPCCKCRRVTSLTHDAIRAAVDADVPPPCVWCEAEVKHAQPTKLTAAEVVLLAAADLHAACQAVGNPAEFSEWELTVAAWMRDRDRFGMRGFPHAYPDHKRVYMEIVGQKNSSPIVMGFMVKVRPNTYRMTPRGVAQAELLEAMLKRKGKGK